MSSHLLTANATSSTKLSFIERRSPIRVIIADKQSIYRMGIRKILALEDDIRVVAQAESLAQMLAAANKFPADIILLESSVYSSQNQISDLMKRFPAVKIVVLHEQPSEDDTVDLLKRGVRGILSRSISPDLLVRCVRKVAEGETWLDNRGVNWVLEAYRAQAAQLMAPRSNSRLSEKELLIISCVTQGMRNKEIAIEVGTTEQVIKNYLRKIYDKLGVSDRLELALYCIHHKLLQGQPAVPSKAPGSEIKVIPLAMVAASGTK